MLKGITKISIAVILSLFILSGIVSAQSASGLTVQVIPEIPGPNEQVDLKLVSYSLELGNSTVSWYIDNKLVLSKKGARNFSFTTSDIGVTTNIRIAVNSPRGNTEEFLSFTPADVDILWEAVDSYTPPFYKGKALLPSQGSIKILAIPSIKQAGKYTNADKLTYVWEKDYKKRNFNEKSGYGKKSLTFTRNLIEDNEIIGVTVSTPNGSVSTKGRTILRTQEPEILFYKKSPLSGTLYENAIKKDVLITDGELEIVAEPYFFSVADKESDQIEYKWMVDNKETEGENQGNDSIIFRSTEEGGGGISNISLNVKHAKKILQFAQDTFSVSFNKENVIDFGI